MIEFIQIWKTKEISAGATGFIQSYNYAGGLHLANQDYSACIRTERGYCSISYTQVCQNSYENTILSFEDTCHRLSDILDRVLNFAGIFDRLWPERNGNWSCLSVVCNGRQLQIFGPPHHSSSHNYSPLSSSLSSFFLFRAYQGTLLISISAFMFPNIWLFDHLLPEDNC